MTDKQPTGGGGNILGVLQEIFERSDWVPYASGDITMSSHHLATAFTAQRAGASPSLVAASLLHDFGHYGVDYRNNCRKAAQARQLDPDLDVAHAEIGARVLAAFFAPPVTDPIRLHVRAKRYLSATDAHYLDKLGPQRVHTLDLQGGPLSAGEVKSFEAEPHFEAAVALRRFEDLGAAAASEIPDFAHFRPLLRGLLGDGSARLS